MTRNAASRDQAKYRQFNSADLPEQIRLAMPLAREIVWCGIENQSNCGDADAHVIGRIARLVGHDGPRTTDAGLNQLEEIAQAAYALGIAIGLLVNPALVQSGGAR